MAMRAIHFGGASASPGAGHHALVDECQRGDETLPEVDAEADPPRTRAWPEICESTRVQVDVLPI
jgi:hypothetical protein